MAIKIMQTTYEVLENMQTLRVHELRKFLWEFNSKLAKF